MNVCKLLILLSVIFSSGSVFAKNTNPKSAIRKPAADVCTDMIAIQKSTMKAADKFGNGGIDEPFLAATLENQPAHYVSTTKNGTRDHWIVYLSTNDYQLSYSVFTKSGTCEVTSKPFLVDQDGG